MKDLRNHINEVANQHTERVDNDALWAGIEQKMGSQKKERRFLPFILWGLSFLFVTSVLGLYYYSGNFKSDIIKNEAITKKSIAKEIPTITNSPTQISNLVSSESKANVISNDNKTIGKSKLPVQSKKLRAIAPTRTTKSESGQINEFEVDDQNSIISSLDIFSAKVVPNKSEKTDNLEVEHRNATRENKVVDIFRITSLFKLVSYTRPKITLSPVNVPSPFVRSNNKKRFSFLNSLTVYSQYGTGSKTIIHADNKYAILRNESEELLEQLRIGIETDIINLLDFTLYGGISYISINDRISWHNTSFEDLEITYLKSIIISPDGSRKEFYATEELPHLTTKLSKRYNSHRLISMPIGMRFTKEFSKLNLGIGFGLDFNYFLSDTHTLLSKDNKLTSVPVGGKWISPSLHTAILAEYPITDRWYIHSKFMCSNTSFDNVSIKDKGQESYSLYGIDLGLKLNF